MVGFVNPLQSVVQGQQFVDNLFQQQAQRGAGAALARGDYSGGANALYRAGDIRGGAGVQQMGQQAQAQQQAATDQQRLQQLQTTQLVIQTLKRARTEGQDTNALLQQYRPTFLAMGTNPQEYDQIAGMIGSDPNFLDQIDNVVGQQVRELSYQKAGDNLLVFEQGNPDPVRTFTPPPRPIVSGGVSFDPVTGQPIADTRRPEYFNIEGEGGAPQIVAIGPDGRSQVAYQGAPQGPEVTTLGPDEVASLGLAPGVYQRDRTGRVTPVSGQGGDRLSAGQQRQVEGYYQEIAGLDNIDAELGRFRQMIQGGQLELGPVANTVGGIRNALGVSSENSRNLAEFRSTLERIRNDSLRLNNGTQTEGDANRAWQELVADINDPQVVLRQLQRIQGINERARRFRQQRIDSLEGGARQQEPAQRSRATAGTQQNPIRLNPNSPRQSYNNIRSGQYYTAPDGSVRQKQ